MDECRAVVTHDGTWLKAQRRAHEQEVTIAPAARAPYDIRDEYPASQTVNLSAAHSSLERPGRQSGLIGLAQTEYPRQAEQ